MLLVDLYDPTEDIKRAPNQVFAKIFLWFFQLILHSAQRLACHHRQSYDRTKATAEIHKVQPREPCVVVAYGAVGVGWFELCVWCVTMV